MNSSSTQTVSMLITDLVGSTAMAERLGPASAEQLRSEHFELLREALERSGGREVKNLGDGLMVAFGSASQSLECAVEMQQAIETRNRRAEERLGVRIGVSLGDVTAEDGDYFGLPAVEAARLCAAAEGGQIIVNELVRLVAGEREGDRFRPLGGLVLKGISEPVQAFELQWDHCSQRRSPYRSGWASCPRQGTSVAQSNRSGSKSSGGRREMDRCSWR